jgi:hypothetical protein
MSDETQNDQPETEEAPQPEQPAEAPEQPAEPVEGENRGVEINVDNGDGNA